MTPKYFIVRDQFMEELLNLILFESCDDLWENKIDIVFEGLTVIYQSVNQVM